MTDGALKVFADKIRQTHSAYWMGGSAEDLAEKVEEGSIEYLERLRKIQRATSNFVKIVTGKNIPVVYSSGQQSYTSGKEIVLSADPNPLHIDSLVGCALHEGAHCLLSNQSLDFLPLMHAKFEDLVRERPILDGAKKLNIPLTDKKTAAQMGGTNETVIGHVQMVMNVLEDRRIDLWMYTNAPGYRPYYDSLYNRYWHSEDIDKSLQNPAMADMSVEAYFMFIINMTNPNYRNAMPGLDEIRKLAGLNAKTLDSRGDEDKGWGSWRHALAKTGPVDFSKVPKLFGDAVKIVEIVYANALKLEMDGKGKGEGDEGEPNPGDLPNMDGGTSGKYRPATKEEIKKIKEALAKQKKFLDGNIDKKEMNASDAAELDQLNQTNAKVSEVSGDFLPRDVKAKVVIYRNITKEIVRSPAFPFGTAMSRYGRSSGGTNPLMVNALASGLRMGAALAHRIRVMQDESPLTFNRQRHGKMDKHRIAGLGHGLSDVFQFTVIEKKKPVNLWMDIDFSGSMGGEKGQKAMAVAVAIAKAASLTRTLNCTIAVRDGSDNVRVAILYDSRKQSFAQFKAIVPYLTVSGGTPESLAFEAVKEEMLKAYGDERKYFINLSDGEPAHGFHYKGKGYSYGGEHAYSHTRRLMNEFRQSGIQVLSYYIGYGDGYENDAFRQMYGASARFIDPSQISAIARTLNALLMKEE
jgi:hypothetical protein